MRFKTLTILLTAIACQFSSLNVSAQQVTASSEYQFKAALLYNFSVFTEWPVTPPEAFDFCILGKDPFGAWLDNIARKTVQGKSIRIRRLGTTEDVKACHLLFVPAQEKDLYYRIAPFIKQQAILTITDALQVDEKWPMIMITLVPETVVTQVPEGKLYTFDINHANAKAAGLTLSSKLLRLARNVK
jgi:hypothetical protein